MPHLPQFLSRSAAGGFDPGYGGYDILLRGHPGQSPQLALEDSVRGDGREKVMLAPDAVAVTVDGARRTDATMDTEWNALRLSAGLFERVEVSW